MFRVDGGGVWLRRGWYPSEPTSHGPGNWAGPATRSDVAVKRGPNQRELAFDVIVINGITHTDITPFDARSFIELPVRREAFTHDRWRYQINLAALREACEVALMVPDCYAAINVFPEGDNGGLERRSFLATGWALSAAPVAKPRRSPARQPVRAARAARAPAPEALPAG
ncbi:MAG: hypothetical protein ACK54U_02660 [Sphingomonadales bacterium]